jgi:hypothetical protein
LYLMRIHESFSDHSNRETASGQTDDPGLGSSTPLATIAAPGAAGTGCAGTVPVDQKFKLPGLKPLRRLKHPKRGNVVAGTPDTRGYF